MRKLLSILLLLFSVAIRAQDSSLIHIEQIPQTGILLDKGWKFHVGDNLQWATPEFNDSQWQAINPTKDVHDVAQLWRNNIVWFRLHLAVDSALVGRLALTMQQAGACEMYLDGHLVHRLGVVSKTLDSIKAFNPLNEPLSFPVKASDHVLAIRYALQPHLTYSYFLGAENKALNIVVNTLENANRQHWSSRGLDSARHVFRSGAFFLLAVLYLAFYFFNRSQKINLLFSLYALLQSVNFLLVASHQYINQVAYWSPLHFLTNIIQAIDYVILLYAIYQLLEQKRSLMYYTLVAFVFVCIPINFFTAAWGWLIYGFVFTTLYNVDITRISFTALKKHKKGAWIIAAGGIAYLVFWLIMTLGFFKLLSGSYILFSIFFDLSFLSIPVAVSIYLGYDFALTNRSLQQKLSEVERLSQEKQQILSSQREVLEQQVTERTAALNKSLAELKATQQQLIQSEKMASLGELTAGIAHEIQNPLNFVNNFADINTELVQELMQENRAGKPDEVEVIAGEVEQNLQKIAYHGRRADAIVKSMLEHSRTSKGAKQHTDINVLVNEYLRLAYHGFRARDKTFNTTIQTHFDERIGKVNIVPQEIGRVLLNLFNNAFYAVAKKQQQIKEGYEPTVTVSTKKHQNEIEICVQDNGMGIPQQLVDKIFQPFFTTKPTGEGTGLGLSLSYDIIKAYSGELKVESQEGEGATFYSLIPVGISTDPLPR